MARTFIPKNAGMTMEQIVEMVNDHIDTYIDVPKRLAKLPAAVCQKFVNDEHDLREDCVDMVEEEWVDSRDELIEALISKTDGGKAIVKSIKEERGY